ncbi:MAG: hypothetical protein Q9169_007948 [Polycauliona sp. 2 TL-2023]
MSSSQPTGEQDQDHGQGQSLGKSAGDLGIGQVGRKRPHVTDADVDFGDLDTRLNQCQQQTKQHLSAYSIGDGSSSGSVLDGLDEWLGMDSFLQPMMTTPLEKFDGSVDMLDETMEDSMSGDADSLIDFDELGLDLSPGNFHHADKLVQPLIPSHGVVSPLNPIGRSTGSQQSAPGSKGHETLFQAPDPGHWSDQTPKIFNDVQPIPGPTKPANRNSIPGPDAKSSRDCMVSPGLTSQGDGQDGCSCLTLTACLLEELGAENARSEPATMDLLLGTLRWALAGCTGILDCERCTSLSDNNMLLGMVGQYMSILCERIVVCYIELQRAQHQGQTMEQPSRSALPTGGDSVSGRSKEANRMTMSKPGVAAAADIWFSTYRIDNDSERMQVLRCLARVQLAEFSRLLGKLQARAGSRRGHLVLLTEAEKRIKAVRLMLRAQLGQPPCEKT